MMWQEAEGGEHEEAWERLRSAHGILVPGGFGSRGVEGKILAAQYAREHNIPYLGICLGMQVPFATPYLLLLALIAAEHQELHVARLRWQLTGVFDDAGAMQPCLRVPQSLHLSLAMIPVVIVHLGLHISCGPLLPQ